MDALAPPQIGPYPVLGVLGRGGMGAVYLGLHRGVGGFEKKVALKCIAPHLADDESFIRMLIDEARITGQLTHPNIVQVIDLAAYDGVHVLVLEYVEGVDLRTLAAGAELSLAEAAYAAAEAARGLAYAHRKTSTDGHPLGIVHRDISGHNLLVSAEGAVKVLDFGVAKAASNRQRTEVGVLKGKLPYMSPEQAMGKPLDGRSDLFSLAIVLWELCTRARLFAGDTEMQVLMKVQRCEIERASKFVPGFPRDLDDVLIAALQSNPADRYANGDVFADALMGCVRSHQGEQDPRRMLAARVQAMLSMRPQDVGRLPPAAEATGTRIGGKTMADRTMAAAPSPMSRGRRRWGLAALVAVLALIAMSVLTYKQFSLRTAKGELGHPERVGERASGGVGEASIVKPRTANSELAHPAASASIPRPRTANRELVRPAPLASIPKPRTANRELSRVPPVKAPPAEPQTANSEPQTQLPPESYLSLNASPWARVFIDGVAVADSTPLIKHTLSPGKHVLVLVNPERRLRKSLDVELAPGAHERLTVTLP